MWLCVNHITHRLQLKFKRAVRMTWSMQASWTKIENAFTCMTTILCSCSVCCSFCVMISLLLMKRRRDKPNPQIIDRKFFNHDILLILIWLYVSWSFVFQWPLSLEWPNCHNFMYYKWYSNTILSLPHGTVASPNCFVYFPFIV